MFFAGAPWAEGPRVVNGVRRHVRGGLGMGFALALGAAVAWLDTRPNWDDTGITAGCLFLAAGVAVAVGVRWWLAAVLVALPLLAVEYRSAGWSITLALLFTSVGAGAGSGLAGPARRRSWRDQQGQG